MKDDIIVDISKIFFARTILSEEACLELAETAIRILLERIPLDTTWHINRYNTDNEFVAHFWRNIMVHGEQSFDVRVSKKTE